MEENSSGNINKYLPLLYNVARYRYNKLRRLMIKQIEYTELVNIGFFGLNEAIRTFDPGKKCSFESYAWFKINCAISHEMRVRDPLSKDKRNTIKKIQKTESELMQFLGRMPIEEEIAEMMGISLKKLQKLKASVVVEESLEGTKDEPKGLAPIDIIPAEAERFIPKKVEQSLAKAVDNCIRECLNAQQTLILLLMDSRDFTAKEVVELIKDEELDQNAVYYQRNVARSLLSICLHKSGYVIADL
ncbi:MAG TPA: sigma factor [bacterium]|nr:sigma factor [bacterium]HPG45257.1 sigma factor [bacterium]HPM99024.1 sigma factor [bacterium]